MGYKAVFSTGPQDQSYQRDLYQQNRLSSLSLKLGIQNNQTRLESAVFILEGHFPSYPVEAFKSQTNVGSEKNLGPKKIMGFWAQINFRSEKNVSQFFRCLHMCHVEKF